MTCFAKESEVLKKEWENIPIKRMKRKLESIAEDLKEVIPVK